MGKRLESYADKLGFTGKEKNDFVQDLFQPYRVISMAKHGNSMLQRNLNVKLDKDSQNLVIAAGPDATGISLAIIALSIEHALSSSMKALSDFFIRYHPEHARHISDTSDELEAV